MREYGRYVDEPGLLNIYKTSGTGTEQTACNGILADGGGGYINPLPLIVV